VFATEHPLHLGLVELLFELCELFFDLGGGLRVTRLCQLEKNLGVVQLARLFFPLGDNVGQGGAFFQDSLGFFLSCQNSCVVVRASSSRRAPLCQRCQDASEVLDPGM